MESKTIVRRNRKLLIGALLLASILVFGLMVRGITMFNASATCQEVVKKCHGVPIEDSCYGVQSEERKIVPSEKCDDLEQIEQRCDELAKEICDINEGSIGTRWASRAKVEGQTCRSWNEEYDFDLRSC